MSGYREPAPREPGHAAPSELSYVPSERADQRAGCLTAVRVVAVPVVVGGILCLIAGSAAGIAGFALLLAASVWHARRAGKPGALLRVERGELRVHSRGSREPTWRIPLANLEDVFLETKTVERIVEGGSANLGMTYLNPRIAPPTDTNRIALQPRGGAPFPLTDEFFGHADSVEWFGKIRVFLRKSGWTPDAEREEESAGEEAPSSGR